MSVQPELWVERPATAVDFYERAFGARVLHRVGDGEDIVAQLAVGGGAFWVGSAGESLKRFSPGAIGGGTCRILLIVDDPDALVERAVGAGATETSPIANEHEWRLGRIVDPFGHEWEIGRPPAWWPQISSGSRELARGALPLRPGDERSPGPELDRTSVSEDRRAGLS